MYVLKSSSPLCCGFLHLFLMYVFRIISSLSRVGKFVKVYVFELHHRANTSSCDEIFKICAYCSVKIYG